MNNNIRKYFFIAITFLYLMAFSSDSFGSANYHRAFNVTHIELIDQSDSLNEFQLYENPSSQSKSEEYVSFYLENIFKCRKKLLLSVNYFNINCFNNQQRYYSPFHHILSILQKNNTWHQSSDDDPFPNDYC